MTAQHLHLEYLECERSAPTDRSPYFSSHQASQHHSCASSPLEDTAMRFGNGTYDRKISGRTSATSSRPTSPELTDWLADQLRSLSIKEIARLAECNERTAENAKLGKSAFNMASLTAICRNHPGFGAKYGAYIGLINPGEAESAEMVTRLVNAFVRRGD